ncbi:MAG: ABC transporter ATP-binding protein [Roseiflexaceae bacterium]|nr:ABC transporter ATP-binding protein [Roseiflexaceae bacterium]
MNTYAIETSGLHKRFGSRTAVADLTLQVPRGEVFGFLGPNGAGKSTSVKMLLGLVTPSGGTARVLGHVPGDPLAMARIGFLPEHFRFHPWLEATELLDLHGNLYGMPRAAIKQRIPEVLELVGLSEHAHRPISGFSKGMLQRIGLAQALLNKPDLVFLDEPTSALDPFGRILVRTIISGLREHGTTIFLNSHLLGEVEATCDRVAFIRNGEVLRTIAIGDVGMGKIVVRLELDSAPQELLNDLRELAGELQIEPAHDGQRVIVALELTDDERLPVIAAKVQAHGALLYAMTPKRMSLEQLFLEVIGTQDSGQ